MDDTCAMVTKGFVLLFVLNTAAMSSSAFQTDWSGGPDGSGPVSGWDSTFHEQELMEWSLVPGSLSLQECILEHHVINEFSFTRLCTADIDGDSDIDILSGESMPDCRLSWFENTDGYGFEWTQHNIRIDFQSCSGLAAIDLNGNGHMDVAGSFNVRGRNGAIYWFENIGGTGTSWLTHPVDCCDGLTRLSAGDMDGDGTSDLVAAYDSNNIRLYLNTGGTGLDWTVHTIPELADAVNELYLADVDGDGDLDIVAAMSESINSGELHWFENLDGTGTAWVDHTIERYFRHACSVEALDFDADGDCDVVASGNDWGDLAWFENLDGEGMEWQQWKICLNDHFVSFATADLDCDGDMDVAAEHLFHNLDWFENADGSGTQWICHTIDDQVTYCRGVHSDDMNQDGRPDVIAGSGTADYISWWELEAYAAEGELVSKVLDTGCLPEWGTIDWNGIEPDGTDLYFRLRSSDDPIYMGSWSLDVTEPGDLGPYVSNGDRYFQYMVIMEVAVPSVTPVLEDITVTWDHLSTGGGTVCAEPRITFRNPFPAQAVVPVTLTLPGASQASVALYDLSGRLLYCTEPVDLPSGEQEFFLPPLTPGLYIVRASLSSLYLNGMLVVTAD